MSPVRLPSGVPLRVVGDVHGDAVGFAWAAATDRFVVQLGDLVDQGPRSDEALRIMFRLIDAGQGLFLLGNHDHKLARALAGQPVRLDSSLEATLRQLDPGRLPSASPLHRVPARRHERLLRAVADRIGDECPISARGILLARELLRSRIQSGEWGEDDALPTEDGLAAQFNVSRATVRQALTDLVREGLRSSV